MEAGIDCEVSGNFSCRGKNRAASDVIATQKNRSPNLIRSVIFYIFHPSQSPHDVDATAISAIPIA